jgi:hypothetical protein
VTKSYDEYMKKVLLLRPMRTLHPMDSSLSFG